MVKMAFRGPFFGVWKGKYASRLHILYINIQYGIYYTTHIIKRLKIKSSHILSF